MAFKDNNKKDETSKNSNFDEEEAIIDLE